MMATLTIDFSQWLATVKSALPEAFGPIIESMATTMQVWGKEQLDAWFALARSQPDAAQAQLLAAMSEAALTAQIEADGARLDAHVAANADSVAQQKEWLTRIWQTALAIAATLIAGSL